MDRSSARKCEYSGHRTASSLGLPPCVCCHAIAWREYWQLVHLLIRLQQRYHLRPNAMRLQVHGSRQAGRRLSVSSSSRGCYGRLFRRCFRHTCTCIPFTSLSSSITKRMPRPCLSVIATFSGTSSSRRGCRVTCRGFRFVCVLVRVGCWPQCDCASQFVVVSRVPDPAEEFQDCFFVMYCG
jgi:hypothetical protein